MKLRPQIKYLFSKQVLESEVRDSMEDIHLILRVHRESEIVYVSDGCNQIEMSFDSTKNPSKKKFKKIKESDLLENNLYIFENCRIKFDLKNDVLVIQLQCFDFKLIMPILTPSSNAVFPTLNEELQDYEKERIKRRVT